ncbi:MAG: ASCH domain-containing protein [Phycisphaeraceae bacterium]
MPIHVAILRKPYLDLVLAGVKTVESRLARAARPPFRAVETGQRIFLKRAGGPFAAMAIAGEVEHHGDLDAAQLDALRRQYNARVCGDDAYWHAKRNARCASFIELTDVEPIDTGPGYRADGYRAWFVLPDDADPVRDVPLTAGALRNRYVTASPRDGYFPRRGPMTLLLPDGREIATQLATRGHLRWRGWGGCFTDHALQPGDRVRFVALGGQRYRVSFVAEQATSRRQVACRFASKPCQPASTPGQPAPPPPTLRDNGARENPDAR